MSEIYRIPALRINLSYGVIYVVTSLLDSENSVSRPIARAVTPHLLRLLKSLTGYKIEVVRSLEVSETTLIARRINVGNTGNDAVVEMPLGNGSLNDIHKFVKCATDVLSTEQGDKELENSSYEYMIAPSAPMPMPKFAKGHDECCEHEQSCIPSKKKKSWIDSFKHRVRRKKDINYDEEDLTLDEYMDDDMCFEDEPETPAEIYKEENELQNIEQQQAEALKAIQAQILDYVTKYHADPSQLIQTLLEGKIVIGRKSQLSPLVVNNDLKIVLPNYNEVEVKMPAMCRTIYVFFLKHPEGIALRDIVDYRADLEDIYSVVMPGRSEAKAQDAISNLLDPMSNTLNEYISKIKRCFKSCIIDEELASNYIITGKRGEPYRINIDPALITLPRAVKGE